MEEEEREKRSEEVQDIVERMPTRWAAWTALVVTVLMCVVLALGFVIEYPDTVSGQISLTSGNAPVRLVAGSSGRLHLLVANRRTVSVGTVMAYIENGAILEDVLKLEEFTDKGLQHIKSSHVPDFPGLGDLSASYNNFLLALKQYELVRHTSNYDNMRSSLKNQIEADSKVAENLDDELDIKSRMVEIVRKRTSKDSLLKSHNAISEMEYDSQYGNLLSQLEAERGLRSTRLAKLSDISRNRTELAKIDIQQADDLQQAHAELLTRYNNLKSDIRQWKEKYLFAAPITGRVEYLGFWHENTFVQAGQEAFSVIPEKNDIMGEAYIPAGGAGKIEKGQDANIKLNDFPYNEYGYIKGRVTTVSAITNKMSSKDGNVETYLVTIMLPEGTVTNYGKKLNINFEAKGIADVITKKKRLIERLFDNLKSKTVK